MANTVKDAILRGRKTVETVVEEGRKKVEGVVEGGLDTVETVVEAGLNTVETVVVKGRRTVESAVSLGRRTVENALLTGAAPCRPPFSTAAKMSASSRFPFPRPRAGELIVHVGAALTCGTDLKVFRRGYHARRKAESVPQVSAAPTFTISSPAGLGVGSLLDADAPHTVGAAPPHYRSLNGPRPRLTGGLRPSCGLPEQTTTSQTGSRPAFTTVSTVSSPLGRRLTLLAASSTTVSTVLRPRRIASFTVLASNLSWNSLPCPVQASIIIFMESPPGVGMRPR